VNGSSSHTGLGAPFTSAWVAACSDPLFLQAQDEIRDTLYFRPAVDQAIADGLGALGQFCYFDHSILNGFDGMINGIRTPVINGGEERHQLRCCRQRCRR
jgi:chitosanase